MTDAAKLDYAIRFLRRKKNLGEIRALADAVGAALLAGQSKIAITSSSMEGGSGSGEIEFEAGITGQACEALLEQAAREGVTVDAAMLTARARAISHTVVFG